MKTMREALLHAQEILPPPSATADQDMDQRARAALAILVERALEALPPSPIDCTPDQCPNCGGPAASLKSPYCSECCKSLAAFIRQFRNAVQTGAIEDAGRQSGLGQAFWRELGGGHPHRQSLLVDKSVAKVFERAEGKCELCGAPAVTIDHIGSG